MKLISKRASLIILVLAVVCLVPRYFLCYWCGYYQKSFASIFWQELLALFGLILILAALITWTVSLLQKKQRLLTSAVLAGLLSLFPWPHNLILYGMRDGMLRNYALEDMRHFARDFDQLPNVVTNGVNGRYTKFCWNRMVDDDLAKTGLKEKYPFLHWCEAVRERDDMVDVFWGGFDNHWGFTVAVNGKKIGSKHFMPNVRIIRESDDIVFTSDY